MRTARLISTVLALTLTTQVLAQSANENVSLPDDYRDGVHYTTVKRGNITEEIYTSEEAVSAARSGETFPDGTVITMDDFRDGQLFRILVMEKRAGWANQSQSGAWLFRQFSVEGSPDANEDGKRCEACHASQSSNDFVFTRTRMID